MGIRPETAAATWEEIGACVARAGIKKIILYNSHGGNHALAEVVARRLRLDHDMVAVLALNLACFDHDHHRGKGGGGGGCAVHEMFPEDELLWGIHGGSLETSVMMHLRPDLVDTSKARRFESSAAAVYAQGSSSSSSGNGDEDNGRGRGGAAAGLLQKHALGFGVKTGWLAQDLNPHGVVGDALDADATRGEKLVEAAAAGLARLIVELHGTDAAAWTTSNVPLYPPQGGKKS